MRKPPRRTRLLLWCGGFLLLAVSGALGGTILIDGQGKGSRFDGIGALSAGASSRLLVDYPEKQRAEILDYLFKPDFGAALQINKVEIGGDMNSTDGSEPSHMRTRQDENYQRGYEWWLMEESKLRNPGIKLYALEWGAPNWINPKENNVWTPENIEYLLKWISHAQSDHQLTIDYVGGWNERGFDKPWYEQFHAALVKGGYKCRVVADDSFRWTVGQAASQDPGFAASFDIIGMHYPKIPPQEPNWSLARSTMKPLWGSEIGSNGYNRGAAGLAKTYNDGHIDEGMTAFINWSTVWSVLPGLPYTGDGLMLAAEPWSGHYVVGLSIWATAHTTQFAQPGWQYLDEACGHLGTGGKDGSYVTLRSPDGRDYSVIVETVDAKSAQALDFAVSGGLSTGTVHVWRTNLRSSHDADWFIRQADLQPVKGGFSISVDPGCIYSLTTTTGQAKGATLPPPSRPWALPYRDDFQGYAIGRTPRYFSDQNGAFEIATAADGGNGKCLRQVITAKPVSWSPDSDPGTIIGDLFWKNYAVSVDARLEQPGYVDLVGRTATLSRHSRINGYHLRVTDQGHWSLFVRSDERQSHDTELASGNLGSFELVGQWHRLSLGLLDDRITAAVDGKPLAVGVVDKTYSGGLAGLQVSRWQNAEFKDFQAVAAP